MKDQNWALFGFLILVVVIFSVEKCAAQAPDADSLAVVWDVTSTSAATYTNPEDPTNWQRIWYNIEGASRIVRYYENDELVWARTIEQGWIQITPELRTWYDKWDTDSAFRTAVQALVSDFIVIDQ